MAWIESRGSRFLVAWRDVNGRRHSRSAATREEAQQLKAVAEFQLEQRRLGMPDPDDPDFFLKLDAMKVGPPTRADERERTLAGYLRRIIDRDKELRKSTREQYTVTLRTHIEGTILGNTDVRLIEAEMIRGFWEDLDAGVGARRNVYLLLSKAFNRAIRDGIIDISPLVRAGLKRPPKGRQEEVIPLTVAELEKLAAAAAVRNPRDRIAVLLMGYAGLRAGEVGGLRLQDIDFHKCKLSIRQQVVQTHSEKYISPLKTKAARRTIEVACSVVEEIATFLQSNPPASDGRILHGVGDDAWAQKKINRAVHVAAERAGLPPVNSHQLRHTAVSLLVDAGANPRAIQSYVGHSDISMTLGTYGHLFDAGGSALAASMEGRRVAYRTGSTE